MGARPNQRWTELIGRLETFEDSRPRIRIVGTSDPGLGSQVTVAFRASTHTPYVTVHVQNESSGGSSYDPDNFLTQTRYETTENKSRSVSISRNDDERYYAWLIPTYEEPEGAGTYTLMDGQDGSLDGMSFVDLGKRIVEAAEISVDELSAISADVGILTAGVLRDADARFYLDLTNTLLTITDNQTTPVDRVYLGDLGTGTANFGIEVYDETGGLILGATGLGGGVVGTSQLVAEAVTAAKIAAGTITANEIAAGTITASEIATGTITASEIAAGTITASEIAAGTITSNEIAANTISATEIAADTITASELAAGTITATEIASAAITTAKLDASAVTAGKIAADAIDASHISAGAVDTTQLAADAVTAAKILAGTITASEIAAGTITANEIAADTITANEIAASTITASELAVSQLSAITADVGVLTAGRLQDAGGSFGILLSGTVPGGWSRWLNLVDSGSAFLKHNGLTLDWGGGATFSGNLSAAGGTFSGDLDASGGTFSGTVAASTFTASLLELTNTGAAIRMTGVPLSDATNYQMELQTGQIRLETTGGVQKALIELSDGIIGFDPNGGEVELQSGKLNLKGNALVVSDGASAFELEGTSTATSAGASSGKYLVISVNGTTYKIELFNF